MYQEKRPTCVTVIGWAWIIIGGFMLLTATMALAAIAITGLPKVPEDAPLSPSIFPFLAIVQLGWGATGVISGNNFLKLKAPARGVLEVLTWLLLILLAGFMVIWLVQWLSSASGDPPLFFIMGIVMGVINTAIFTVPLIIMLKYLRGPKVKGAMRERRTKTNETGVLL